jgi:hypothetical protein
MQPQVVQAVLQVAINENIARARVKEAQGKAEGIRDASRIKAGGEGAAIRTVGQAQGAAYRAQADVIGADRVALVRIMEEVRDGKIRITPGTLVSAGAEGGSPRLAFSAYLATLLSQKGAVLPPASPAVRSGTDRPSGGAPPRATDESPTAPSGDRSRPAPRPRSEP